MTANNPSHLASSSLAYKNLCRTIVTQFFKEPIKMCFMFLHNFKCGKNMNCPKAVICPRSYSQSVMKLSLYIWKSFLSDCGMLESVQKSEVSLVKSALSLFTAQSNKNTLQRGKICGSVHQSRIQGMNKEEMKNDFDFHFNHSHNNCCKIYLQKIV